MFNENGILIFIIIVNFDGIFFFLNVEFGDYIIVVFVVGFINGIVGINVEVDRIVFIIFLL